MRTQGTNIFGKLFTLVNIPDILNTLVDVAPDIVITLLIPDIVITPATTLDIVITLNILVKLSPILQVI